MSALNDEDKANLVAYLDGELDEEAAQALEAKLSRDPHARAELDSLRQVYGLLDFLPKAEPSENFTNRTMERLTLIQKRVVETGKMPRPPRRNWLAPLGWALLTGLLFAVGLWGANWWWHEPVKDNGTTPSDLDEVLVRHLRVVEKFQQYDDVDDLDFVRALDHPELFGDEGPGTPYERGGDGPEQNRRRLEEIRKNPELFARVKRDAQSFQALKETRRDEIIKLDRDLHQESPGLQARLAHVLERYNDWLDALEGADRQQLRDAPDTAARLKLVRELRDQQWLASQPKAIRDTVAKLAGKAHAEYILDLRQKERQNKIDWTIATRFWADLEGKKSLPMRLTDLDDKVQVYVREYLKPLLAKEEWDRLEAAQGKWPQFPMTLVELADKHPPALPGSRGPTQIDELPTYLQPFVKGKVAKGIDLPYGKWPQFAQAVAPLVKGVKSPLVNGDLWPLNQLGLSPEMKEFVEKKLRPLLSKDEIGLLESPEISKWPDYPQAIQDLSRKYGVDPPWFTLPPSKLRLNEYRVKRL